jgi:hypothetical protein
MSDYYTYDDGSTLTFDGADWSATPATAADIVQSSSSGGGGFFDILDSFTGIATKVGGTIITLEGQKEMLEVARAKNELERYRTLSAVNIGKSKADVATINAQRDVAVARAQASLATLSGGNNTLLIMLILAGVAVAIASQP